MSSHRQGDTHTHTSVQSYGRCSNWLGACAVWPWKRATSRLCAFKLTMRTGWPLEEEMLGLLHAAADGDGRRGKATPAGGRCAAATSRRLLQHSCIIVLCFGDGRGCLHAASCSATITDCRVGPLWRKVSTKQGTCCTCTTQSFKRSMEVMG